MKDTQSYTESLLEIVKGITNKSIMLPEFQRDFRWEIALTYDLFDSLIKEIFIGTLIYGKPSFGMTLREIDLRPRKKKKVSTPKPSTCFYTSQEIKQQAQMHNLRIVLDGQQRLTSIYRAITGIDDVYIVLKEDLSLEDVLENSLEGLVQKVSGEENSSSISIKLSVAYEAEVKSLDDEDLNSIFQNTVYAKRYKLTPDDPNLKTDQRIYRRTVTKIRDFLKQQKLVAYYLLDMSLGKFCTFFERSNSRSIQLNFTDILAAKLYENFNLRKRIEESEMQHKITLNREVIIRAIAFVCGQENKSTSIEKSYILENLEYSDFQKHWDKMCELYALSNNYLQKQYFVLSQAWMPSENMLIPIMLFARELNGFEKMNELQRAFFEYWYWASIFFNSYSSSSNEVIIVDSTALIQVARGEKISYRPFFKRLRSLITEPNDLFTYNKKSSGVYRGMLNLIGYDSKGLYAWSSTQKTDPTMQLEDHHIYPRAYISNVKELDMDKDEAEELVDCVVNRTLIPKDTNLTVGKKSPNTYLSELKRMSNPRLEFCLKYHLIKEELISNKDWDEYFREFLDERSKKMFELVKKYATTPAAEMQRRFGTQTDTTDIEDNNGNYKTRLSEMIADGRVKKGDRVYVFKQPDRFATIIDGSTVEFEGTNMSISGWGVQMTGWQSINISESVYLERTRQPLKKLEG